MGQTPLHTAVDHNRPEEVKFLLKAGADPNARESPGALIKQEYDSDPAKLNEWGLPALHCAVWHTRNLDIITALLDAGADPNMRAHFDRTPLHSAVPPYETHETRETHKAIVRALVKAGANLEARNETDMWTPLHWAAQQSATATKALLEAGANVEARCYDGSTPLHLAVSPQLMYSTPNLAAAKVLLEGGANPNARDKRNRTPLHQAATDRIILHRLLEPLLEAGANLEARDNQGHTPLHLAAADWDVSTVEALIKAGADPNARTKKGHTPLHRAVASWNSSKVDALIKAKAYLNTGDEKGKIPPQLAVSNLYTSKVEVLIKAGAEVEARDKEGRTPLHHAAARCFTSAFVALVKAGADPDARDFYGKTPGRLAHDSGSSFLRFSEVQKVLEQTGNRK